MTFDKKHRPRTLDDVIFADPYVKQTLEDYAANNRSKHLLLHGPAGSGKSVSAQITLIDRMGASQAGLNAPFHARTLAAMPNPFDLLRNTWSLQILNGARQGCVVIDEFDQLTLSMQQNLRAFIDQSQQGMIIATSNNLHLIDVPLKDRFCCLSVEYPTVQDWVPRVIKVMHAEGIPITEQQANIVLNRFVGSGRLLNDWLEDYVVRQQRFMPNLTNMTLSARSSS